ncbi:MAG: hypothetical protein JNK48_22075, partial [Bryobacterales bacterium]|nr:hypothetical protein [Bryobacterales bacterium]
EASREWKVAADPAVRERVEKHVRENCPQQPAGCIEGAALTRMAAAERELLLDWVDAGAKLRAGQLMAERLLGVIERQISGCSAAEGLNAVKSRLRRMGFAVIPAPWIQPGEAVSKEWPGVSYGNAALIGDRLFLPALGLERVEKEWLAELQRLLPKGVEASYVPARFSLLRNGGIHCLMAFGRKH